MQAVGPQASASSTEAPVHLHILSRWLLPSDAASARQGSAFTFVLPGLSATTTAVPNTTARAMSSPLMGYTPSSAGAAAGILAANAHGWQRLAMGVGGCCPKPRGHDLQHSPELVGGTSPEDLHSQHYG